MTTYLTIITTVLVVTQIIRVTQNGMDLRRRWKVDGADSVKRRLDVFDKLEKAAEKYLAE